MPERLDPRRKLARFRQAARTSETRPNLSDLSESIGRASFARVLHFITKNCLSREIAAWLVLDPGISFFLENISERIEHIGAAENSRMHDRVSYRTLHKESLVWSSGSGICFVQIKRVYVFFNNLLDGLKFVFVCRILIFLSDIAY